MEHTLLYITQIFALATFIGFMLFVFLPKLKAGGSYRKFFFKDTKSSGDTIVLIIFYLILFGHLFIFNTNPSTFYLYVLGFVFAAVGLLVAFIGRMQLRRYWTPVTYTAHSGDILDTGLFRYSRHPIYIGRMLFFLGVFLMFNPSVSILTIAYWYILRKKAKKEERLLASQNKKYADYMKRVPRLF